MDGLGTVYLERIRIKRTNPMQIALICFCKIELGTLTKYSITEKNSAIAADGKIVKQCSIILENISYGKILKSDVGVAKNYLEAANLEDMQRLINVLAIRKEWISMTMEDFEKRIDIILEDGGDVVLTGMGDHYKSKKVSAFVLDMLFFLVWRHYTNI